jgi:Pyridoxamine 5'-phosphate oxidase
VRRLNHPGDRATWSSFRTPHVKKLNHPWDRATWSSFFASSAINLNHPPIHLDVVEVPCEVRSCGHTSPEGTLDYVGKVYEKIDDHWRGWIAKQPMFFVGTAPLQGDGHVNISPKGPIGSLRVLDDHTVAFLDVVGSGVETIAHLRENGRIVVMLCAFQGPPRILRLHGRGEVLLPEDAGFDDLMDRCGFDSPSIGEARRSIVVVHVSRIADSCGYGVPLMSHVGEREHHAKSSAKRIRTLGDGYEEFVRERNAESIDGLPAMPPVPARG